MVVKQFTSRIALAVMVVALSLHAGGNVHAVTSITDQNTVDSALNGFDPSVNLLPAALRTSPAGGPCFVCPNTSPDAGNTTAGSLTDSMFGVIKPNNLANVGQEGRAPFFQGQTAIPTTPAVNNASAFTVTINTPGLDDLDAGTAVPNAQPTNDLNGNPLGPVGTAGMRMDFSTSFTFRPGAGSMATQNVEQATFTGSQDESSVQLVRFIDSFDQPVPALGIGDDPAVNAATINWDQTIQEGGFLLSNNVGTFTYNEVLIFPLAGAPTGPSQTAGTGGNCIGTFGAGIC